VEHANRPRLHLQIALDAGRQKLTDTRGRVSRAAETPGAALLEGRVEVHALAEVPTRSNYSLALQQHSRPPQEMLERPFTWIRRLLYVKDATAEGMNYLVVADDTDDFDRHTPSFNYWSLSERVELKERSAHFTGQLGIDTDLIVASPSAPKLFQDAFTHDQCEPIISEIVVRRGQSFREKQVLARIEGERGRGFLVVVFPRKADEPRPEVTPWLDGKGVKVTWKGQTHHVLLDTRPRAIDEAGIRGQTSCLVLKTQGPGSAVVCLPAGGDVEVLGKGLRSTRPAEWAVAGVEVSRRDAADLLARPR
jgi:hypothetical protein